MSISRQENSQSIQTLLSGKQPLNSPSHSKREPSIQIETWSFAGHFYRRSHSKTAKRAPHVHQTKTKHFIAKLFAQPSTLKTSFEFVCMGGRNENYQNTVFTDQKIEGEYPHPTPCFIITSKYFSVREIKWYFTFRSTLLGEWKKEFYIFSSSLSKNLIIAAVGW